MPPSANPSLPALTKILEGNYDPHISQCSDTVEYLDPKSTPVHFYDRHVASHLVLKNVVYSPKVKDLLSGICEQAVQHFLQSGYNFEDNARVFPQHIYRQNFDDASSVARHFNRFVGRLSSSYGSKFMLHPECETWDSAVFMMNEPGESRLNFTTESYLTVISQHSSNTDFFDNVDQSTKARILDFSQRYPRLATWDMFAMTETATAMFQAVTDTRPFVWDQCRTHGYRKVSNNFQQPVDATPPVISVDVPTVSKSPKKGTPAQPSRTRISKVVTVSRIPSQRTQYRPNFSHYLQHAWAKAAMHDSTFIILHCGRYERIGFRHRASQTLYLSGVIDTVNVKNPSYRKLQVGLHIAIIKDALKRLDHPEPHTGVGIKQPPSNLGGHEAPTNKCGKHSPPAEANISVVGLLNLSKEIAKRKLALVSLDYGAFCSPVPSSFVRIGPTCVHGLAPGSVTHEEEEYPEQTRFQANEYFHLTLQEPLRHGAVGVVHPAFLEMTTESGDVLKYDLALRLAFSAEQRELMLNEYRIYGHLSQQEDIEGIVAVHGIFMDPESGALGLLMNRVGQSLSPAVKKRAFRVVLKTLHKAGVQHNDVRPENLLISPFNKAYIIDFDRAALHRHAMVWDTENRLELEALEEIFDDECKIHDKFCP